MKQYYIIIVSSGLLHLMQFVPVSSLSEANCFTFDDRFARAYHLRGVLFHAMGEHRYLCNHNC